MSIPQVSQRTCKFAKQAANQLPNALGKKTFIVAGIYRL